MKNKIIEHIKHLEKEAKEQLLDIEQLSPNNTITKSMLQGELQGYKNVLYYIVNSLEETPITRTEWTIEDEPITYDPERRENGVK